MRVVGHLLVGLLGNEVVLLDSWLGSGGCFGLVLSSSFVRRGHRFGDDLVYCKCIRCSLCDFVACGGV